MDQQKVEKVNILIIYMLSKFFELKIKLRIIIILLKLTIQLHTRILHILKHNISTYIENTYKCKSCKSYEQ